MDWLDKRVWFHGGMNAKAETTLAPTAEQIEKWISDERRQLLADPNLQINLEGQRLAPLEAADYVALNRVEQHLSECIERQERAQERISLLTRRLQSTRATDSEIADAAIAEQAEALRAEGIKLIRTEYPKVAKPLIALFERMRLIDSQIGALNRQLHDGDKAVSMPNSIRTIPEYFTETKIPNGRCTIDSPLHPRHGAATYLNRNIGERCYAGTEEPVRPTTSPKRCGSNMPLIPQPSIPDAVVLPGVWPATESK